MKIIAGIGLFIGACAWVIFFAYILYEYGLPLEDPEKLVPITIFSISSVSAIYYVWITLFRKPSAIESIEMETKIIKAQIEKKELLATLEALERNE